MNATPSFGKDSEDLELPGIYSHRSIFPVKIPRHLHKALAGYEEWWPSGQIAQHADAACRSFSNKHEE